MIREIIKRIKYWIAADRLGPDIPLTHLLLYFPMAMRRLCVKKFKHFGVGAEFRPGAYAVACSKISIGDRVVIRPGTMIFADTREQSAGIVIEDNVMIASGVHFYNYNHSFSNPDLPLIDQGYSESKRIKLEQGCWVGANAIILAGVTIGRNAVVGAGSVVTRDVPAGVVAAGNPARVIRKIGL